MNRPVLTGILIALSSAALSAQQSGGQNPYQGTSNPPGDEVIVTDQAPPSKPHAAHPMPVQQPSPEQAQSDPAQMTEAAPSQAAPPQPESSPSESMQAQGPPSSVSSQSSTENAADGTDAGIVGASQQPAPAPAPAPPALAARDFASDPDGDIVHPRPLRPGELGEGTTIRVKLLDRLSTALTGQGEPFHSQVATDVLQGGQVLIPAGTEIDGTVVEVSGGHVGGSGSIRLRPEQIILADGTHYRVYAQVTGTPGSHTRVVGEGAIKPDSRWRRDSIEYGGAVGAGAIAGAVMAGPVGALTGGLIGAGAITAHLLVSHPQATLEPGTILLLELTGPLQMTPVNSSGN